MPIKQVIDAAGQGLVLKPIIMSYLHAETLPDFVVHFRNEGPRRPDGYFHPSSHPMLTARQLYFHLVKPDRWITEPLEYTGRMSVTFGSAMHGFVQHILSPERTGVLLPLADEVCRVCGLETGWEPGQCNEPGVVDEELGTRGHLDGMGHLAIEGFELFGWELKTFGSQSTAYSIADNDVEAFKRKWPGYWWQIMNYLLITGLRRMVVTMIALGFPWPMLEFVVDRDEVAIQELRQKYHSVRRYIEEGRPPPPCCNPGSKEARCCPARASCSIGQM